MRTLRPGVITAAVLSTAFMVTACGGVGGGVGGESDTGLNVEERDGALYIEGEKIAGAKLYEAAKEEGTLTLYTTLSEVLEVAMVEDFEAQTGISVEIVRHNGSRLFELIESEHGAGKLQADVIRRSDLDLVKAHQKSGVFEPYCPPAWDKLVQAKDPDCEFWASNETVYAIGYNTEMVSKKDAPRSWDDLLDPQWKGKIGLNNITGGGTTWSRDSFLRIKKSIRYWEQLAAQKPHITTSAGTVADLNARGEVEVGMALLGTHGAAIDDGAPLKIVLPEDGLPSSAHWMGLAKGAARTNAAKVFINWNASLAGQTSVALRAADYPVREDAPGPVAGGEKLPPRSKANLVFTESLEPTEADRNRKAWMAEWLRIFNYTPDGS